MTHQVIATLDTDVRAEPPAASDCAGGCACGDDIEYLQSGPEAWRLSLVRRVA